jgi:alpha-beta hydrolase superfamily lysophospholipase
MQREVLTPSQFGISHDELYITTPDGIRLHGWHLRAQGESKGSVIFFHGNAENITTHIASIYWLPEQGIDVYIFDYRGYGRSEGVPSVDGVILDAVAVMDYVATTQKKEFVVFGQSLGCAVAINAVSQFQLKEQVKAVAVDSCFSGFREIAREKLSDVWLTWPLQYPLSLAFTSDHSPIGALEKLPSIPLLVIHGNQDHIIPEHHGVSLYNSATTPKQYWEIEQGRHIDSMTREGVRKKFTEFLTRAIDERISPSTEMTLKLVFPTIFEEDKTILP